MAKNIPTLTSVIDTAKTIREAVAALNDALVTAQALGVKVNIVRDTPVRDYSSLPVADKPVQFKVKSIDFSL